MKSSIKLLGLLVSMFSLVFLASGCYTQLATTSDEGESSYGSRYERPRANEEVDTTAPRQESVLR